MVVKEGMIKMIDMLLDALLDALLDSTKLLPFLFITYLVMEYLEHKTNDKLQNSIRQAGKFGPVIGSVLGAFPQCGFSAAASNLYAGRVITVGTLISIYLSTSDEMLPILISQAVDVKLIFRILGLKVLIGILAGLVIDFIVSRTKQPKIRIHDLCEHEHCHCENGIFRSAISHTLQIFWFIFVISILFNIVIGMFGEEGVSALIINKPFIGSIFCGIVGLIPNCVSSVVITQLYLEGAVSFASMMAGLLVGAGVGILVLFRVNEDKKENFKIVGILYLIGIVCGFVMEAISLI